MQTEFQFAQQCPLLFKLKGEQKAALQIKNQPFAFKPSTE